MQDPKGLLIVLSGPSGVGKGTVREAIFSNNIHNYVYSVSATTRAMRPGEEDGRDYYFVGREEFEGLIQDNALLEYAEYVGNYYGTPIAAIEDNLDQGRDVFLEIEVQGAMQIREKMPQGVFIFLAPPSIQELENRLVNRGTDAQAIIYERIQKAREEMDMMRHYDYVVVNDEVDKAVAKINAIIQSEHLKVGRVIDQMQYEIHQIFQKEQD